MAHRRFLQDLGGHTVPFSPFPLTAIAPMQEFLAFMSSSTATQLVVDRSSANELLKINFNVR